jgi:hypothetical protein
MKQANPESFAEREWEMITKYHFLMMFLAKHMLNCSQIQRFLTSTMSVKAFWTPAYRIKRIQRGMKAGIQLFCQVIGEDVNKIFSSHFLDEFAKTDHRDERILTSDGDLADILRLLDELVRLQHSRVGIRFEYFRLEFTLLHSFMHEIPIMTNMMNFCLILHCLFPLSYPFPMIWPKSNPISIYWDL